MGSIKRHRLTVFEHQSIKIGQNIRGVSLERKHLDALEKFYGSGSDYFSLIHNGIKFNEYAGVLQVGNLTIEVLPKADRLNDSEPQRWRGILLGMLKAVGAFDIKAPSSSSLNLKSNSILDLYFELFIVETERLLHQGLVKRYRKTEGNLTTLKGSIQFSKHVRQNLVHKERFYTRHTVYDQEHLINLILYKAVKLVLRINTNAVLSSRVGALMLNFPELPDIKITREHFDRLVFDRKTESYRKAIDIARMLLLNYHPDIRSGKDDVLALMFDMNILWEQFVFRSLQRYVNSTIIEAQNSKDFWKPEQGQRVRIRPDIVINKNQDNCFVLDTKWKIIEGSNPSPVDLRQMFVYAKYYQAKETALIYPGTKSEVKRGMYYDHQGMHTSQTCGVITLPVESNIQQWQINIAQVILRNQTSQTI